MLNENPNVGVQETNLEVRNMATIEIKIDADLVFNEVTETMSDDLIKAELMKAFEIILCPSSHDRPSTAFDSIDKLIGAFNHSVEVKE